MSSSWTRAFGLSMIVCLTAVLAAPALAADPAHVRAAFPVSRGTGPAGLPSRGLHLLTSLQVIGLPVVGPLAVLSYAGRAIRRFILPSTQKEATAMNLSSRVGRAFNRSALPLYSVSRGANGTAALGFAENLTAYLGGKGYDVADLNAALSDARTAIKSSNLTAFRGAVMNFRKDLDAKIAAGTIDRSVFVGYLQNLSAMNPGAGERGIRTGMRSLLVKGIWQIGHRGL